MPRTCTPLPSRCLPAGSPSTWRWIISRRPARGRFRLRGLRHRAIGGHQLERCAALSEGPQSQRTPICRDAAPAGRMAVRHGPGAGWSNQSGASFNLNPCRWRRWWTRPSSPALYFRTVDLSPGGKPPHFLHIVADSAAALELKPEDSRHFSRLVAETGALFGARHYRAYHFLLTLSDHVAHFGLEHHESSDNRQGEKYLTDADLLKLERRPAPARDGPLLERQVPPARRAGHARLPATDEGTSCSGSMKG